VLRGEYHAQARIMPRMGLFLAAVLVPAQLFFGHLVGDYVHDKQPVKFAAIEGRWHDEQPASEVLIALPRIGILIEYRLVSAASAWLVVTGVVLCGAFPPVYATLLSAFYLPLLLMLAGLILRGVAFEYRHRAEASRWIWDIAFAGGSLAAAFVLGMTVGALVEGLPVANGQYISAG
jgi:cytochrome bd-type quinol oxidase subunit 1